MRIKDTYRFDTIAEIKQWLDRKPDPDANRESRGNDARQDWDFGLGYDKSERVLVDGWVDGAERAHKDAERLALSLPQAPRVGFEPGPVGAFANVPAYLANQPDSMWMPTEVQAQGAKLIDIYMPGVFAWFVPAEAIFRRGVATAAVIDALEEHNYRCRVYVYVTNPDTGTNHLYLAKDHQEPLFLEDLMFMTAHPAFLRRIHFAVQERHTNKDEVGSTWHGYGSATYTLKPDDLPLGLKDEGAPVIFDQCNDRRTPEWSDCLSSVINRLPEDCQAVLRREE